MIGLQAAQDLIAGCHRHLLRVQEAAAGVDLDLLNLGRGPEHGVLELSHQIFCGGRRALAGVAAHCAAIPPAAHGAKNHRQTRDLASVHQILRAPDGYRPFQIQRAVRSFTSGHNLSQILQCTDARGCA